MDESKYIREIRDWFNDKVEYDSDGSYHFVNGSMAEESYLRLVREVIEFGCVKGDRTGTGIVSTFAPLELRFYNPLDKFPAITMKKLFFKTVVDELLWILSGSTNVNDLPPISRKIWSAWANEDGTLGKTYGYQMREASGNVDQWSNLINGLKTNPNSRRHIISLWDAEDSQTANLPPCHGTVIQFYVEDRGSFKGRLHMKMYQRSADVMVGVPFNIASYAVMMGIACHECDLEPGWLTISFGDAHIYLDHLPLMLEYLDRPAHNVTPYLQIKNKPWNDLTRKDIKLVGYQSEDRFDFPVSV